MPPDEALSIDIVEVFTAVATLRTASQATATVPAMEPPDVGQTSLSDALWRLSFLARNLPTRVASQVELICNAVNQGAIDTERADVAPVVEVPTGTTSTTTTSPSDPPASAETDGATSATTPPVTTTTPTTPTTTTTTTVPGVPGD